MKFIRRILAILRREPTAPSPVDCINPKPWTVTGRKMVGTHINNVSWGSLS